ncbi:MAG: hypothetical protein U9N36_00035 [Euryarchaeota archaeon]|nr:hypothetical protein [Euryarchaeota archaeon]
MAKNEKRWLHSSSRAPNPRVPELVKIEVKRACDEFVESVLKPRFIDPDPQEECFNYIVDIFTKWYSSHLHFYAKYRCPGPNAIEPFFETKFARMEYVGRDRFNLSYMRHTGKWLEVYPDMSLDECIEAIRDDPLFRP